MVLDATDRPIAIYANIEVRVNCLLYGIFRLIIAMIAPPSAAPAIIWPPAAFFLPIDATSIYTRRISAI